MFPIIIQLLKQKDDAVHFGNILESIAGDERFFVRDIE